MLGPFDCALWIAGFLLEAFVVVSSFFRRDFKRYIFINLYMLCVAFLTVGGYICLQKFGFASPQYFYYYYYTNGLVYVFMYLVIIQFYLQVFVEMKVSRYITGGALLLLGLTALFSFLVVHQNREHLTTRFVGELEQNLNFVGVVLTYLLWGAIVKLRETRARLVQLVLALGIYYSATAGTYALHNLFPSPGLEAHVLRWLPPLFGTWLPFAWAYTFTKVPEESRLAPGRLAVRVGVR